MDDVAADSGGRRRSSDLRGKGRPQAELASEVGGHSFAVDVHEYDASERGWGDAVGADSADEPVTDDREFEQGDGFARKLTVVVLALVLVGAGLGGWIYHSGSASSDLPWTSGEEVAEVLKAGGWNLAPPTVEQSSQREVWRIIAFKSGKSVVVRVVMCGETSTECFDSGSGTWLEGSGMGIQILAGPGGDSRSVDTVVQMLAPDAQSFSPHSVGQ